MNHREKLTELQKKDKALNEQYRAELIESKDGNEFVRKMDIKTRRYRLELYKIIKEKNPAR